MGSRCSPIANMRRSSESQDLIRNQSIDAGTLFVARVDCDQGGWPEPVLIVRPIDLFPDLRRLNNGERPGEFGISVNQRSVEFEDIQDMPQCECVQMW